MAVPSPWARAAQELCGAQVDPDDHVGGQLAHTQSVSHMAGEPLGCSHGGRAEVRRPHQPSRQALPSRRRFPCGGRARRAKVEGMDARHYLGKIGEHVEGSSFAEQRSLLAFDEYLELFYQKPYGLRPAVQLNTCATCPRSLRHRRRCRCPGARPRHKLFDLGFAPEAQSRPCGRPRRSAGGALPRARQLRSAALRVG